MFGISTALGLRNLPATPGTPPANVTALYAKADGLLYRKSSDGIEHVVARAVTVISPTNPNLTEPGLWIQTFANGDMTFWIEDGQ